jgi:hypothetical protein
MTLAPQPWAPAGRGRPDRSSSDEQLGIDGPLAPGAGGADLLLELLAQRPAVIGQLQVGAGHGLIVRPPSAGLGFVGGGRTHALQRHGQRYPLLLDAPAPRPVRCDESLVERALGLGQVRHRLCAASLDRGRPSPRTLEPGASHWK